MCNVVNRIWIAFHGINGICCWGYCCGYPTIAMISSEFDVRFATLFWDATISTIYFQTFGDGIMGMICTYICIYIYMNMCIIYIHVYIT